MNNVQQLIDMTRLLFYTFLQNTYVRCYLYCLSTNIFFFFMTDFFLFRIFRYYCYFFPSLATLVFYMQMNTWKVRKREIMVVLLCVCNTLLRNVFRCFWVEYEFTVDVARDTNNICFCHSYWLRIRQMDRGRRVGRNRTSGRVLYIRWREYMKTTIGNNITRSGIHTHEGVWERWQRTNEILVR